ncbi:arginase [Clostridium aciditolerans]|uniref:Arginase n=1 Tax=Clostridium aciditolerans TaxID=339861 RepID=A0A934HXM2_9CLOT|nr:arginase [Clostridium aciditolerans]MBI6871406.1 arginase [Clostridium aciditolerans]
MNISLIGVPIFFGSDKKGADFGPKKLREKNIVSVLTRNNHTVYDCGDIYVENIPEEKKYNFHTTMKYLKPIVDVNKNLAHQVYSSLCAESFPLVIGGDHSIGLGSISGASKFYDEIAVIWIDAHGDINTHETSPTGNVHGMPLAAAMGLGFEELIDLYDKGCKVKPENIFIIGARDLDLGEKELIKKHNLTVFSTEDVQQIGVERIMEIVNSKLVERGIKAVHLSFDIDCLDSNYVPGTGTPVREGMNVVEVKYILKYLMETKLVKSMDFVELNPLLDKGDTTADLCIDLLSWTFGFLK